MANYTRIYFLSAAEMQSHVLDASILARPPFAEARYVSPPPLSCGARLWLLLRTIPWLLLGKSKRLAPSLGPKPYLEIGPPPAYAANPPPLLDWIRERLDAGEEELVAAYLFRAMPGITAVTDFRGARTFGECADLLSAGAPPDVRERLGLAPVEAGNDDVADSAVEEESATFEEYLARAQQAEQRLREQFFTSWDSPLCVLQHMQGWQLLLPRDIDVLVQRYTAGEFEDPRELIHSFAYEWDALAEAHRTRSYAVAVALDDGVAYLA